MGVEHITRCDVPGLLAFARGRVSAIRASGLRFGQQRFAVNGGIVTVRVKGSQEFIHIEGTTDIRAHTTFSHVQYPEVVTNTTWVSKGAKLRTGTFPGTDSFFPFRKTHFGTTAAGKKHIRLVRLADTYNGNTMQGSPQYRVGVNIPQQQTLEVYLNGEYHSTITANCTFLNHTISGYSGDPANSDSLSVSDKNFTTNTFQKVANINSSELAVACLFVVSTVDSEYSYNWSSMAIPGSPSGPGYDAWDGYNDNGTKAEGTSHVLVLVTSMALDGDGNYVPSVSQYAVGSASYTYKKASIGETRVFSGSITADTVVNIVNDVDRNVQFKKFSPYVRVATGKNGVTAVLRMLDSVETHLVTSNIHGSGYQSAEIHGQYSASFLTKGGVVHDNLFTRDLGEFGIIMGVIHSHDGNKIYLYYALHDPSEVIPLSTIDDVRAALPTVYNEYLDVVNVTRGASFTMGETISLGQITLNVYGSGVTTFTDCEAYRLRNASQEVNGFIWADRYCYIVSKNLFMEIPGYVNYSETYPATGSLEIEQMSGDVSQNPAYILVSRDGRSASYVIIKAGIIKNYSITYDTVNSVYLPVVLESTEAIPANYFSYAEVGVGEVITLS